VILLHNSVSYLYNSPYLFIINYEQSVRKRNA